LFLPVYRIFGSEELSSKGKAISELIPKPFLLINSEQAEKSGFKENEKYELNLDGKSFQLILKLDNKMPLGIAGISVDLPGMPFLELPIKSELVLANIHETLNES
jgi:NADH-quinone oxidoreductase subunit G